MQSYTKWWRRKTISCVQPTTQISPEWFELEKAIQSRNLYAVAARIQPWCRLPEAAICTLKAYANYSGFTSLEVNKIEAFFEFYSTKTDLAFERARQHMKEHGFDMDLHIMSLFCLYLSNQFEDALVFQRQLSSLEEASIDRPDYWKMICLIRWANNDMNSLEVATDRAVELAPDDGNLLQTALNIYIELGAHYKIKTLRAKLVDRLEHQGYNLAICLLALGEYELGGQLMEGRYDENESHRMINPGLKSSPRWRGESLVGARLLLSAEQGTGDTIQMARYLSLLSSTGCNQVLLETSTETLTLLQYNFPEIVMVARRWEQAPELGFDLWTGMMSLPHLLNAWGKTQPGCSGYLRVPPENTLYWKDRVEELSPTKKPKIGLAWSGKRSHRADLRRSIPFEQMMRSIRNLNVIFFSLQTNVPKILPANLIDVSEELITFADTAALIEQMDILITVDTSVVHIAGALGKATWLLLPKRYEWRWGLEGEENDWYDSVKVIRQTEHANWAAVLQEVFEHRLPEQFNF